MTKPAFKLEASIDEKTGRVVAVYFRIREGAVAETREIKEGDAFADYDADGLLLGIELLGPCEVQVLDAFAQHEPEATRRFLTGGMPRELIVS
jgi:hypothetical protein